MRGNSLTGFTMKGMSVAGVLLCATAPGWAKSHVSNPSDLAAAAQKTAMKALRKQQHQQWSNLHRQESQENKMAIDKGTLHRLQKEQRDALKRQQKLQRDLLKGR